jgi:hypothetical protein
MIRWAGHVARIWKRNAYKIFLGKPKGNRPLGRPRRRLADNIKIDLGETGWGGVDWMEGSCEHCNESSDFIKWWGVLECPRDWWLLKKVSAQRSYLALSM